MDQNKEVQLRELMEDISSIKSVIKKNQPLLHYLFAPKEWRRLSLIVGAGLLVFPLAYYLVVNHYGSYAGVPGGLKLALMLGAVAALLGSGVYKNILFLRSARKIDPAYSPIRIYKELYDINALPIHVSHGLLALFFTVFFAINGNEQYIVPTFGIMTGLLYNFYGAILNRIEFTVPGYWMIITSVVAVIHSDISILISLIYVFAVPMFLFSLVATLRHRNQKVEE